MEQNNRAAVHEPPPTGNDKIVLQFVLHKLDGMEKTYSSTKHLSKVQNILTVKRDLEARAEMGKAKYGTYLRINNGRDALIDLVQENYDAIMYASQLRMQGDLEGSQFLEQYINAAEYYAGLISRRSRAA